MAVAWPVCARLLPLSLLLAAAAGHLQLKVTPSQVAATAGQDVRLRCEASSTLTTGCTWLRHRLDEGAWPPTFLIYTSSMKTQLAKELTPAKIWGKKEDGTCSLIVRNVSEDDQGHYFCMVTVNSVMHASPLVPVLLPAQPTTKPAPPPTTQVPNRSPRPGPCRPGAAGAVEKRGQDFACDIYIWSPLAGICTILLLSLVITVICHHRNRRRVCKCPRPVVRQGGKPSPSGKYV